MSPSGETYHFARYRFDPETGDLTGPGGRDRLRPQAAQVLALLLENHGALVTREELQEAVWPDTVVEFDQGLNACIREIRKALDDSASDPRFVETFPRRGYRFLVEVRKGPAGASVAEGDELGAPQGETGTEAAAGSEASGAVPGDRGGRRRLAVALLLVAGAAALGFWAATARAPDPSGPGDPGRERLLVLPLASPGGDAATDTVADILTTRLIGDLSRLAPARLGVIARTSSNRYRGTGVAVAELGRTLDLDYVVEGSVIPGAEPAVELRLIDARDETQLWSGRFPLPREGVAEIADRLSQGIAGAVAPELEDAHQRLVSSRAGDSDARDALARVHYLLGLHTMDDTRRARAIAERALEDAPGHPGLVEAMATIHQRFGETDAARRFAMEALEAQPASAEAHRVLGRLAQGEGDWDEALRHYQRAVTLAPAEPEPRNYLAAFHNYFGREDEAVEQIEAALAVDPVSATIVADAGVVHLWAGRYQEAEEHCRAALELNPDFRSPRRCLIQAAWLRGRPEEGAPAARELLEMDGPGAPENASPDQILERYWSWRDDEAGDEGCGPVTRARVLVVREDVEAAARAVSALHPDRWRCLLTVAGDEMFAEVREDPEVSRILTELGLRG